MATSGRLELTEGVLSAHFDEAAWMDAAISGEIGGVELALSRATVHVGHNSQDGPRRAPLMLVLATNPTAMRALGLLLLTQSGAPVFNEREWRIIAEHCRMTELPSTPEGEEIADRIEEAYKP